MARFRTNKYKNRAIVNGIGKLLKLNRGQKALVSAIIVIIAIASYFVFDQNDFASFPSSPRASQQSTSLQEGIYYVSHIVDGDTIDIIDNKRQKYRIRLIGANAPETAKKNMPAEPYADKATDFTKQIITINKNQVRISFDGDRIDKYGRNLAMVYVNTPKGEIWLNEALIYEGLAKARLQYNFSNAAKERLKKAELNAKNARKNIWNF
ncbi:MAG: thermonuclease family protein [Planctomycetaceae bacterium]|jgi:micrococcal nuclease|nr:thermonuclease family protein [Planctomycetaceae bacterium]